MEETISGGRKEKNPRPSINGYMYGNAQALAAFNSMGGQNEDAKKYKLKADSIKRLSQQKLWNKDHQFFEVFKRKRYQRQCERRDRFHSLVL
jgi:glycogen debranching enzyme